MRKLLVGVAALCSGLVAPAHAAWLEAQSDHFIIDADTTEARLREFATKLERFDAALHASYNASDDPARRSDRIRIYAVQRDTVETLSGTQGVAGFYLPRAGNSVIFSAALTKPKPGDLELGSRLNRRPSLDLDAQAILLHEYSHHFMYVNFPRAYPLWFSEGFAEFNGTAQFEPDGSVILGNAPNYRAYGLRGSKPFPIAELFDPPKRRLANQEDMDQLYGRGWLLTHYLLLEGGKQKELSAYIDKINSGVPGVEAAGASFGDLDALSKQMDNLLAAGNLRGLRKVVKTIGPIDIKPLSDGVAAMMAVRLQSERGVTSTQAPKVASQAERIAAGYPNDPRVQTYLAEAELDAGHLDQADAAASRALSADPGMMDAMLFKGRVATRRLQASASRDPRQWAAARGWFIRANNGTPNAAEPLLLYYQSFEAAGMSPTPTAYQGLLRAQQLAPESDPIRLHLAQHLIGEGKLDDARALLRPIAFAPHKPGESEQVRKALDALNSDHPAEARQILTTVIAS